MTAAQASQQPLSESLDLSGPFRLTLPNYRHAPSQPAEGLPVNSISCRVAFQFSHPPFPSASRRSAVFAPRMPVPETSVNKNHSFIFWQNYVGPPRQLFPMHSEPITHPVQHRSHNHLRLGILPPNPAHVPTAPCFRQPVFHALIFRQPPAWMIAAFVAGYG